MDVKHILQPLEPPFGELKAKNLPLQAARILLLTRGPYGKEFEDENGKKNFGYRALEFEYKWISLSFLMQNGSFMSGNAGVQCSFKCYLGTGGNSAPASDAGYDHHAWAMFIHS